MALETVPREVDMTVAESIIQWLKTFPAEESRKMKRIHMDRQGAETETYALIKEPVQNVTSTVTGREKVTAHYMIMARLSSMTDTDRVTNAGFGERLERWVKEQNQSSNFPLLDRGDVKAVSVTTPFCVGETSEKESIYQITISIQYEIEEEWIL